MKKCAGALVAFILVPVLVLVPAGCGADNENEGDVPALEVPGGDPDLGLATIARCSCESCHTIPGAPGAEGEIGPLKLSPRCAWYVALLTENYASDRSRW